MDSSIDSLVFAAVFGSDDEKQTARRQIRELAVQKGIKSSSIYNFYKAIGNGSIQPSFTVPAINIRSFTYDTARIIFQLMLQKQIGPVVFEIARSEIEYTEQRPDEYAVVVLAAAIKEGYSGPVFLQGDHFQLSAKRYKEDRETEVQKIKVLIDEALDAGFKNVDIDASTLVDLSKEDVDEQQFENYTVTAELTRYIRSKQKDMVSIGGEIGHIGGKNSTVADLDAFMKGYLSSINSEQGISKISVQTGTSHGGIPLPDGIMQEIKLDFNVLKEIGEIGRSKYHLGGAVQHGASTLPNELFHKFPESKTLEIHLATGFQNILFDNLPESLKNEMYAWIEENCKTEWEKDWSKEQFVYRLRKKSLGPFKKKLWELSDSEKAPIRNALEKEFSFLFDQLDVTNTIEALLKYL